MNFGDGPDKKKCVRTGSTEKTLYANIQHSVFLHIFRKHGPIERRVDRVMQIYIDLSMET